MSKKRKVTISERSLGREKVDGEPVSGLCWWDDNLIELDPRQKPKEYLNTLIHELIHLAFPDMPETKVRKGANLVAHHVWKQKYRKVVDA